MSDKLFVIVTLVLALEDEEEECNRKKRLFIHNT